MGKNILSDTDYTKGWDNRFGVSVCVGKVSKIEATEKGANVRVILPDRVDHEGNPLITKPVPVLQIASTAKRSFAMPRLNTNVLLVKLPNGTSNYAVAGSFYTSKDPPPVTDPMLDYVIYDDGSTMEFDASTGELTWKLKGDMLIDNEGDCMIKLDGNFSVEIDGDIMFKPQGKLTIDAGSDVLVKGPSVELQGALKFTGDIIHTGNMVSSGTHEDAIGFHVGGAGPGVESMTIANSETWKWTTKLLDASNAGQVGINADAWTAANQVNLSMITSGGRDMSTAFAALFRIGNEIHLQAQADSTRFGRYTIIGETAQHGGWWSFPTRLAASNGAPPANNALTTVTLIQPSDIIAKRFAALEARIKQLETQHGS